MELRVGILRQRENHRSGHRVQGLPGAAFQLKLPVFPAGAGRFQHADEEDDARRMRLPPEERINDTAFNQVRMILDRLSHH